MERRNFKGTLTEEDVKDNRTSFSCQKIRDRRNRNIWSKRLLSKGDEEEVFKFTRKELLFHINTMNSRDIRKRKESVKFIRKAVSYKKSPIKEIISHPNFETYLKRNLEYVKSCEIQSECAWIITNIASFDFASKMMKFSPYLILLIQNTQFYPNQRTLVNNCLWALGNLAADSLDNKKVLVKQGILPPLKKMVYNNAPHVKLSMWCLCQLCRTSDQSMLKCFFEAGIMNNLVKMLIFFAEKVVKNDVISEVQQKVLREILWMILFMSNIDNIKEYVFPYLKLKEKDAKDLITSTLVLCLKLKLDNDVLVPGLRIIGNLLRGPDVITHKLLQFQLAPKFLDLLLETVQKQGFSSESLTLKESAYILSNLAGSSVNSHIQILLKRNIIPVSCKVFLNPKSTYVLKREVMFILINLMNDGSRLDEILLIRGTLHEFIGLMKRQSMDDVVKMQLLRFFDFVLGVYKCRKRTNGFEKNCPMMGFYTEFEKLTGIKVLEDHVSNFEYKEGIRKLAQLILKKYFHNNTDFDDDAMDCM